MTSFEPDPAGPHRLSDSPARAANPRAGGTGAIGKSTAATYRAPPLKLHVVLGVSEEPLHDEVRWAFGKRFVRGRVALLTC